MRLIVAQTLTRGFVRVPILAITSLVSVACSCAFAHDPGLSSAEMTLGQTAAVINITFNNRDIAGVLGEPVESASMAEPLRTKLRGIIPRVASVQHGGDLQAPSDARFEFSGDNNIVFNLTFPNVGGRDLLFRSTLLGELPFGHRQAFVARDSAGQEIARRMLSSRDTDVVIPLETLNRASTQGGTFLEFFRLGIHHIVTGYDHLLFLFGLLVVCRNVRPAAVLITCFTLAHSITLALSTFGLVNLPSRVVEAVIAASILYVGVENLVRRDQVLRGRWFLTLLFGLVHGLGFAAVLREMGIAKTGTAAVIPLVAFNSGVEIGQLMIAAIVLPLLWRVRKVEWFARAGVPACSLFVAGAGAYWLLERTVLG